MMNYKAIIAHASVLGCCITMLLILNILLWGDSITLYEPCPFVVLAEMAAVGWGTIYYIHKIIRKDVEK